MDEMAGICGRAEERFTGIRTDISKLETELLKAQDWSTRAQDQINGLETHVRWLEASRRAVSARFLWSFQIFYFPHSILLMFNFSHSRLYDLRSHTTQEQQDNSFHCKNKYKDWQLLHLHEPSPIVSINKVSFHRRSIHYCVPSLEQFPYGVQIISQRLTFRLHQRLHHCF